MRFLSDKGFSRLGIGLAIVLALGAMYGLHSLFSQRNVLRGEVAELNVKVVQLKNKYAEQKAMAEAMLRAKQAAESGNRLAESLKQENEKLQEEKRKAAVTSARQEAQISEIKERFVQQRSAFNKLREESSQTIQEKNQKISALTKDRDSLKVSLTQETAQHGRCKKNNAELAAISTEVVKKYKNKGVLGSIVSSEPFTQIKKVEHEKLCQEYLDTIDKNTM